MRQLVFYIDYASKRRRTEDPKGMYTIAVMESKEYMYICLEVDAFLLRHRFAVESSPSYDTIEQKTQTRGLF